jgi:2'-5' RNA ligase
MAQKYVIVHFVDLPSVPDEFSYTEWPLHVTLLANFTIRRPVAELVSELDSFSKRTKPFIIVSEGESLFGPKQNVKVSLIKPTDNIKSIHRELVAITSGLGADYDEPSFMMDGYRPHITIQAYDRVADKQSIRLNNFTIVDMYPDNDIERRKIIKTFELSGS